MKTENRLENRESFIARLNTFTKKQVEIDEIMFAYDLAKSAHRTARRDTGERYFEHCRACAIIMLDELNWYDKEAIISILLHDTGEDTPLFGNVLKDYREFIKVAHFRMEKTFGSGVAKLVILLTKPSIDGMHFKSKANAFSFYVDKLSKEPKALLLKMVDRLHNLRSAPGTNKMQKNADETKKVYLPIFEKLAKNRAYGTHASKLLEKIKSAIPSEKVSRKVVCQKWEESERGWGSRPDGYSLHLSVEDLKKFIKWHWAGMPNETPDEYSRPSGTPYSCEVDEKVYKQIVKSKDGVRFYGEHPLGGKDGWLRKGEK